MSFASLATVRQCVEGMAVMPWQLPCVVDDENCKQFQRYIDLISCAITGVVVWSLCLTHRYDQNLRSSAEKIPLGDIKATIEWLLSATAAYSINSKV